MTTNHPAPPKPLKPPHARIGWLMARGPLPMFPRRYRVNGGRCFEWIEGERGPISDANAAQILLEADLQAAKQHGDWCMAQVAQGRGAIPRCAVCNGPLNFDEPPAGETEDPRRDVMVVGVVCTYSGSYKFKFYCRECYTRGLPPFSKQLHDNISDIL
jgi:hypothetical protein